MAGCYPAPGPLQVHPQVVGARSGSSKAGSRRNPAPCTASRAASMSSSVSSSIVEYPAAVARSISACASMRPQRSGERPAARTAASSRRRCCSRRRRAAAGPRSRPAGRPPWPAAGRRPAPHVVAGQAVELGLEVLEAQVDAQACGIARGRSRVPRRSRPPPRPGGSAPEARQALPARPQPPGPRPRRRCRRRPRRSPRPCRAMRPSRWTACRAAAACRHAASGAPGCRRAAR